MNPFASLAKAMPDRYAAQAQLWPALLVISPLLILLCCVAGPQAPILTGLITVASTLGIPFAIAAQARMAGKKLEERLRRQWGGWPSMIVLRHRDQRIRPGLKQRYHEELSRRFGKPLPTAAEENDNPTDADDRYQEVSDLLRLSLRGVVHPHLRRENIAYGFYRNALALKLPGFCAAMIACLAGAVLAHALIAEQPYVMPTQLLHADVPAAISMSFSLAMLIFWARQTRAHLERLSYAYAERLYECLFETVEPPQRTDPAAGRGTA